MDTPKIFESEYRFCRILWENEPVGSGQLVKLCAERLGWKKATTYTVIRRLAERGVLQTENAVVTSLVSEAEVQEAESREIVDKNFGGFLSEFVAAFTRGKKLSPEEALKIHRMIDEAGEDRS